MATMTVKSRIVNTLVAVPTAPPETGEPLPVFEQFVYAICRENATPEAADLAFSNLRTKFFDWNEIRVSTVREIQEVIDGLSDTENRATRILSLLQEVFEEKFAFEMEVLQKKGPKTTGKSVLMKYGAASDYVGAWVTQRTLGGHALPLDTITLRCVKRLGLLDASAEDLEAARSSLEHLVPKAKGAAFTDAISTVAEEFCWEDEPNCAKCPMSGECPSANGVAAGAAVRPSRAKTK